MFHIYIYIYIYIYILEREREKERERVSEREREREREREEVSISIHTPTLLTNDCTLLIESISDISNGKKTVILMIPLKMSNNVLDNFSIKLSQT